MNDLLAFAIDAHGGLGRWNEFKTLKAELSVDGAIWHLKQQAGLLTDKIFEINTHTERLTITPFTAPDRRSIFVPDRLVLETLDGTIIESRENPEAAFAGQTLRNDPWDKFHVAYFASEALWTYLTSPFLYTYPGFESEEIEPWHENGEEWRRLKVTFPDYIVQPQQDSDHAFRARRPDATARLHRRHSGRRHRRELHDQLQGLPGHQDADHASHLRL
jgi:hypothetical protein